jgi:branched-subunit amino acid aminotransferase/4-amino-4-deoxychorismate lyase
MRNRVLISGVLQALRALVDCVHDDAHLYYKSFYSSVLGGITTQQPLMIVPIDDHMVHRGHAVFDTAIVAGGHVYQLEQHLDRFLLSASRARIEPPMPRSQMRRIILDTAAASQCESGVFISNNCCALPWTATF